MMATTGEQSRIEFDVNDDKRPSKPAGVGVDKQVETEKKEKSKEVKEDNVS